MKNLRLAWNHFWRAFWKDIRGRPDEAWSNFILSILFLVIALTEIEE